MDKFLITPKSHNRITGPIMVTTSPRRSCPTACPLRKSGSDETAGACYAEHGFLGGFIWSKLDQLPVGGSFKKGQIRVHGFEALEQTIRSLPEGAIWRHNQAGDLASDDGITIDGAKLRRLARANRGRRGFTYTHFDMETNARNREAVLAANTEGFFVNLSANSLEHADRLADLEVAPVTVVVPADITENTRTPAGRTVVICPARRIDGMTCKECRICATLRKAIIGFPAIGAGAGKITESAAA